MLKSIRREIKEASRLKLGKLKLDLIANADKNVDKTVQFLTRNLEESEITVASLKDSLVTMFDYEMSYMDSMVESDKDLRLALGRNITYENYMEFQKSDETEIYKMYYDMNGKLPNAKNGNRYTWHDRKKGSFGVFNGKKLIAIAKLYKELLEHDETMVEAKDYMMKKYYFKSKWYNRYAMDEKILSAIMNVYEADLNIKLMEDYEKAQSGDYAKSFMTKKNISTAIMERMETTPFKENGFHFVEFDNETDLEKVSEIEKEWIEIYKILTKVDTKTSLRFRKLGNHKALGLYYPTQHSLCVDIRDISAMMHEYGHLLDYEMAEMPISLTEEFRGIIKQYRYNIDKLDKDCYVSKKKSYYGTPTEVFARGFEIYMNGSLETSFLKSSDEYEMRPEYTCFDDSMRFELTTFFKELLA